MKLWQNNHLVSTWCCWKISLIESKLWMLYYYSFLRVSIFLTLTLEYLMICTSGVLRIIVVSLKSKSHHMCPEGACRLTWEEYWNADCSGDKTGSCPTTPRPLTVSNVPDNENMRQFLSRSVTACSPRFSKRILYRHWKLKRFL